jgi:hypothetical protein
MKKLLKILSLMLMSTLVCLAAAACAAPVIDDDDREVMASEPTATLEQANHQACFITAWSNTAGNLLGGKLITVKTMNGGTVACPYRIAIDYYKNGVYHGSSPILESEGSLAPYVHPEGPKFTHGFFYNIQGPGCSYDIHYKYRPNHPSGSPQWFTQVQGPYSCN